MKTKIIISGMALALIFLGCNKDDDNSRNVPITTDEIKANSEMDNISDDVSFMAESESDETPTTARLGGDSFWGNCLTEANVTTETSGNTITRTIDFGATNCFLFNGNRVRGKIIISFTNDFEAATRTISYSFDNFYHNDRHVEGNRTVVKTKVNNHPVATISLDMTVTLPNGNVFHRTGQRVREFTAGYDTPFNLYDNEFSITGNWTTTFPSGATQTATITSPVIAKWTCGYLTSGTITFTRNNNIAILDYGAGTCDNQATITINGVLHQINLGI